MSKINIPYYIFKIFPFLCLLLVFINTTGCNKKNELILKFNKERKINTTFKFKKYYSLMELQSGLKTEIRLRNKSGYRVELIYDKYENTSFGMGMQILVENKFLKELGYSTIKFLNGLPNKYFGSSPKNLFIDILKTDFNSKIEANQLKTVTIEPNNELVLTQLITEADMPKYGKVIKNGSKSNNEGSVYDFEDAYNIRLKPHIVFAYKIQDNLNELKFYSLSDIFILTYK